MRKKELRCKILNVQNDPVHPGRVIVSLQIDDGKKEGPYIRAYSIIRPTTPLSVEQFIETAKEIGLERSRDPLEYLKQSQQAKEEIVVEA